MTAPDPVATDRAGLAPVLVASGMHRSGTSLVASLLRSAGVFIGRRLMGPAESNPPGHFEDLDFVELHERMLTAHGLCPTGLVSPAAAPDMTPTLREAAASLVAARRALGMPWGWKDPRTILFLDDWQTLLPDARWLFVFRSPWEVIDSLFRRGDAVFQDHASLAARVWLHYNRAIFDFVRRHPDAAMVAHVGQVTRNPEAFIAAVGARFGIPLSPPAQLVQESLLFGTAAAKRASLVQAAAPEACELYAELLALAGTVPETAAQAAPAFDGGFTEWARATALERRGRTAERALIETRSRSDGIEAALDAARVEATSRQQAHAAVLAERDERLEALGREVEAATARQRDLKEQLTVLGHALDERDRELDRAAGLPEQITAAEAAAEALRRELAEREDRLGQAAATIATLEDRLTRLEDDAIAAEALRRELAEREDRLGQAAATIATFEDRLTRLDAENSAARAAMTALEQEVARRAFAQRRAEGECRTHFERYSEVVNSNSWWITRPLREARRWIGDPRRQAAQAASRVMELARGLYDTLPLAYQTRLRHRRFLAERFPRLLLAAGSPADTIPGLAVPAAPLVLAPVVVREPDRAADRRSWERLVLPQFPAPLVSIIIPVHDQWAHTHACLRSIISAEPTLAYEVILADDRSSDDTVEANRWVEGLVVVRQPENLGFLRNCNESARRARGEYLLFLNNDTQLQPGAVTALLAVFRDRADAGLVGSKLVYPDGRLQEAGGIVWDDASGWNYGRGQNPTQPEFNYLRETDYCSGASLMVPRSLFFRLGGFDPRYAPAYYEDTDLAFAVRAAGLKVYYQPASVVVHHEGVSHGTDAGSGIKARQHENRRKFLDKWRGTLEREHAPNGQDLFHARDRSARRRCMLVIDHYIPQPDRDAGSRVMWAYFRLFGEMGLNVKFWPQNLHYDRHYAQLLEQAGVEVYHGPEYAGRFEEWARRHGPHLDFVLLSRPDVAQEFIGPLRKHSRAKLLFYGHDLHHARMLRESVVTGDTGMRARADAMRDLEESIWRQVDAVYYPSAEETAVVRSVCPDVPARTVPLYFFEPRLGPTPGPEGRSGIVFVAGFAHPPNVDAAEWLVNEILPAIRRDAPGVHLWLVGSNPTAAVQALAAPDVTVTGYVTDEQLVEIYHRSRVAIVPLRFGAGVKSKVIEALHHGLPLVTTPVGSQGLAGLDQVIPVSADAATLARETVALLRDDARWTAVARAGQEYTAARFSADAMRSAFEMDLLETPEPPVLP